MHTPLINDTSPDLISIVNRKVADDAINVAGAVVISEKRKQDFTKTLPTGLHSSVTGRVKTMETMKKGSHSW